jgi:signal transduction histidine kinase
VLSRWPIRNKLLLGIALLLVIVLTLCTSSFQGTYAFRELARSVSSRATELPKATELSKCVSNLRVTLADLEDFGIYPQAADILSFSEQQLSDTFDEQFAKVREIVKEYADLLTEHEHAEFRIGDAKRERETLGRIEQLLTQIEQLTSDTGWYRIVARTSVIKTDLLVQLQSLATELPSYLQSRMEELAYEVRARYRTWIVLTWMCAVSATALMMVFIFLCYRWVFRPLRMLVKGSRRVAGGDFNYRIELQSYDEMFELAEAMNDMTTRFRSIRDDLDRQVQLRTKQVVRGEQLASVGFLAAGVAHEINNPLASIALCAESLEGRLLEMCTAESSQRDVVQQYLKMIQTEAFRCKEITEKLLDFSRMGEVKHSSANLREIIQGVIDMVRHLGKYQNRNLQFAPGESVIAQVNPQEIKQVVLNLVTNALDSLDNGGTLTIELVRKPDFAEMIFTDDGCGMSEEVLKHLFEPFFTRKRGGQGSGLGLSIVHRIVSDHGGQIEATSAGSGRGSQFHVTLPLAQTANQVADNHRFGDDKNTASKIGLNKNSEDKENRHRYQAA